MTVRVVSAPPSSRRIVSSSTWPVSQPSVVAQTEMRSSRGLGLPFLDELAVVTSKKSWITGTTSGCD